MQYVPFVNSDYASLHACQVGMRVDPPVFSAEVLSVRERHRTTKLCDQLIEAARAEGQLL
jgi:hypothetical protein